MYIAKILSNLGAWDSFQENYPDTYTELYNVIELVQPQRTKPSFEKARKGEKLISTQSILRQFMNQFRKIGWSENRINFGDSSKSGFSEIDVVKEKIGLELSFGKFAFAESDIFVKFPIFIRAEIIKSAILITPVNSLVREMSPGVSSFEMVQRRMKQITPYMPKYPFVIIGVSNRQSEVQCEELSSDLDLFLVENVGLTYTELKLQQERHNCDFKQTLPNQAERIAKEICAFANNSGGGVLLIGVDDNGNKIGVPTAEKDEIQRRIGNIAKDNCAPSIIVSFKSFEIEDSIEYCLLAVRINEIERKPCMSQGKIFIRDNATAVPANPDQVRRLLFGSLE